MVSKYEDLQQNHHQLKIRMVLEIPFQIVGDRREVPVDDFTFFLKM